MDVDNLINIWRHFFIFWAILCTGVDFGMYDLLHCGGCSAELDDVMTARMGNVALRDACKIHQRLNLRHQT